MKLQEIDIVFSGVIEIHEMTMQLQAALEDCLEMAEENRDDNEGMYSCPNIGVCFLDLAEVNTCVCLVFEYAYVITRPCVCLCVLGPL